MPQLGETVAEGKITKWFKAAGDAVKPGDNLFEIETDKTSMEVPSTTAGTLTEIHFQVGEVAKVGAVVAVISGAGGAATASSAPSAAAPPRASAASPRPVPLPQCLYVPRRCRVPLRLWIRFTKCARPNAISAPPSCPAGRLSRRSREDLPASVASTCRASPVRARMAVLLHATSKRRGRAQRPRQWRVARAPRKSRRSMMVLPTKKSRSTPCAAPSRQGWSKPSRPFRTSISLQISMPAI